MAVAVSNQPGGCHREAAGTKERSGWRSPKDLIADWLIGIIITQRGRIQPPAQMEKESGDATSEEVHVGCNEATIELVEYLLLERP